MAIAVIKKTGESSDRGDQENWREQNQTNQGANDIEGATNPMHRLHGDIPEPQFAHQPTTHGRSFATTAWQVEARQK